MSKSLTELLTLERDTIRQGTPMSKAGKVTAAVHGSDNLEICTWHPVFKLTGVKVDSVFSNARSLPHVKLLKQPESGKRPARYLDCIVTNGASYARVEINNIGAIAGVSQTDREVLADLFETVLSMMTTSNVSRPQVTNGFKITSIQNSYQDDFSN